MSFQVQGPVEKVATDSTPGKGQHSLGLASEQNSCLLAESSPEHPTAESMWIHGGLAFLLVIFTLMQ